MKESAVAIVTGAGAGIGRAVAQKLLRQGLNLGVCDMSTDLPETFAKEIADGRIVAVVGDVTEAKIREELISKVESTFGRLDVLVNNAATGGESATVAELSIEGLRRTLEVNLVAVVALTQAAIPLLTASPRGSIVNLGSLFATDPVVGGGAYCLSKGAIDVLTRILALELGPHGITCNTVAPGYIMTKMHAEQIEFEAGERGIDFDARAAELRAEVPVGRHGTPEDIADAITWLVGEDNGYVTGQRLAVNGGVSFS